MQNTIKTRLTDQFLSDIFDFLPSQCLLNKGVTGCGGTTLEIKCKRNSIILVPNINLILNKCETFPKLIGVYGDVTKFTFLSKFNTKQQYKKIIATYDSLPKLIE